MVKHDRQDRERETEREKNSESEVGCIKENIISLQKDFDSVQTQSTIYIYNKCSNINFN